jgi:hypothetical protein
MTDPFEYELTPFSDVPSKSPFAGAPVDSRPTSGGRPGSRGGNSLLSAPLHPPPPVSQVVPRGKLPEESSLLSQSSNENRQRPAMHGHTLSKESGLRYQSLNHITRDVENENETDHASSVVYDSEADRERKTARLSVNHVLTSTEQMDRAIDQFMHAGAFI